MRGKGGRNNKRWGGDLKKINVKFVRVEKKRNQKWKKK